MSRGESIKKWNKSEKGKFSARKYRKGNEHLYKKDGSHYLDKTRRYKESEALARNRNQIWTISDDELVLAKAIPDLEISKKIGRSLRAISNRRLKLKKKQLG